ncbi:MAG: hypothetical protein COB29_10965 [Sulfitobacter sp.]|nr:MAG: hypothetical protein COB29_10965 [Sulfitobacter sp.]
MKNLGKVSAATAVLLLLAGCQNSKMLAQHNVANTTADVGPILISVNNISRWDQVSGALKPNFTLKDGDAALNLVVPATAKIQEQVLSAFAFNLGVGLPQSYSESAKTKTLNLNQTTNTTEGVATTTGTSTTTQNNTATDTKKAGVVPTANTVLPKDATLPAGTAPTVDIGIDPMLKYQAANALYQEVQLLNREVEFAAKRKCYVPYMVRMQISTLPYRNDLPYDLHAKASFFEGPGEGETPTFAAKSIADKACDSKSSPLPYVVPLLVTDNLEKAVKSRAVEVAKQIGLAVNFMVKGVGANIGANNLDRDVKSILANDLNSLLTVSRMNDNSLYIRLGASNQASAGRTIVSKTYDVSLLMLVPISYLEKHSIPILTLYTHTEFRDSKDGAVLVGKDAASVISQFEKVAGRYLQTKEVRAKWEALANRDKMEAVGRFILPIQQSNYGKFKAATDGQMASGEPPALQLFTFKKEYLPSLWTSLSGIAAESPFQSASFALPTVPDISIVNQTALLREINDKEMEIVLREAEGVVAGNISAHLKLRYGKEDYVFPSESVTFDQTRRLLRLKFTSPVKWGLKKPDFAKSELVVTPAPCLYSADCPKSSIPSTFKLLYAKIPKNKPEPGFTLRTTLKEVIYRTTTADAQIKLHIDKLTDAKAVITLLGAEIKAVEDENKKPIVVIKDTITITTPQTLILTMNNVKVSKKVVVTVVGKDLKGVDTGQKKIEFTVVAGS